MKASVIGIQAWREVLAVPADDKMPGIFVAR
jgi:hypothetical protein